MKITPLRHPARRLSSGCGGAETTEKTIMPTAMRIRAQAMGRWKKMRIEPWEICNERRNSVSNFEPSTRPSTAGAMGKSPRLIT